MVLLQSKDEFDSLAELDTVTGQVTWLPRSTNPELAGRPICGSIAQLQGRLVALYSDNGVLHFRVDNEDFALTEHLIVDFKQMRSGLNRLRLLRDKTVLFDWTYKRPVIKPPLQVDPTPFVDEEDYDFGLFVFNVMNDANRHALLQSKRC